MLDSRSAVRLGRPWLLAVLAALTAFAASAVVASPARADAFGELAAFGLPGAGDADANLAMDLAVDPSDGDALYVADLDGTNFAPRLRKFDASGALQASVAPDASGVGGQALANGLAVDPGRDRVYALVIDSDAGTNSTKSVRIVAYSTTPNGTALEPAPGLTNGVLFEFTAANAVLNAKGIEVDPASGDVAVLGATSNDATADKLIRYVSPNGTLGSSFTIDAAGDTRESKPTGFGFAPDGAVYVINLGPENAVGADWIGRYPHNGGSGTRVAGLVATPSIDPTIGGGQLAVSLDGGTVYAAAQAQISAYSTDDGTLLRTYGGGSGASCNMGTIAPIGLSAGSGDRIAAAVTDQAGVPDLKAIHVFGPGGSGCPTPTSALKINNSNNATVTVQKGSLVHFDASDSDLHGATPTLVEWDLDGTGAFDTDKPGSPAPLTLDHRFPKSGTFKVGLKIHVTGGAAGSDPPTLFRTVKVTSSAPTAQFTASTRTVDAGGSITFDGGGSVDPNGSDTGGPSHTLAKYKWSFGDGATQETTTPTVVHAFANAATSAAGRTVSLVVVNGEGQSSAPFSLSVTVNGKPGGGEQPKPKEDPKVDPPKPPVVLPPAVTPPSPKLSGATVDAKGVVGLKVTCPAGGARCEGKLTLTIKVTTKVKGKKKSKVLTLGSGSFAVDAGKAQTIKVKLSAAGKSLLRHAHRLTVSAKLDVSAGGQSKSTATTVKLTAPKKKSKSAKRR